MKRKLLVAVACIVLLPVLAIVALFATRETPDGPRVDAAPGVVGIEAGGAYAWIGARHTGRCSSMPGSTSPARQSSPS